ncbi:hypothetical protein J6TS2_35060 [Heyndrickxia sporothermodurans]|nr:hypothetical protein J6TS2_35060 [Heyndrickxia sporothermodurans]
MASFSLYPRKKKKKFPKALTLLMAFLLIFNGMLPSALIGKVHSVEKAPIEQPKISKDVDGETSKEISKEQEFTYNVNVVLPKDIANYETMVISDDLDQRLDAQGTSVMIDGKTGDTLKTVVDGQNVSLTLKKEEIEELVGKEVKLQITTQVKENAATGEKIDNVAQVVINDNVEMETNPVVVTPIDVENKSSESESKDEKKSTEESTKKTQEKTIEEKKDEAKASSVEPNTKNIAIANSKEMAVNTDNKWLTYKFDAFSNDTVNQLFAVHGAANVPAGSNFIRLTPTTTEQSGAVFIKNEICPKNNYSFSTAFSFSMNNPSAQGPSDGLTFTLQTGTSSQLSVGGGLGYYGIQPSFAVKYDTFLNTVYNDPSANYIGLAENGTVTNKPGWYTDLDQYNSVNGTNYVLSNGTKYYTWIDYDGLSKNVQVRLGTSPDRANAKKVLDVNNIDLGTIFNGKPIHAGFTASTGYPNSENHDIYSWYFVNDYAPLATLNPQNDYKQAPNSVKLKTEPTSEPGVHKVTATLLDPLGNPVPDASLDSFTTTVGELAGPNGEPVADLVSDADGKIHAVLKNADHSKDIKISATVGCANDSTTIPATDQPPDSCGTPVALINGSFEEPPGRGSMNGSFGYYETEVPGWKTTDDTGGVKWIEIWDYKEGYPEGIVDKYPAPPDGNRYAELNASGNGMLYQDVKTTPGQTIYWRLSHKGLYGVDTMQLRIGPVTNNPYDTVVQQQMSDGNAAWGTYSGTYNVPKGQTMTRFGFEAVSTSNGSLGHGNHLDNIFLGTEACVKAEKTVSPSGDVLPGDELTYKVKVKNSGGDVAANAVFEDAIPEGTEYVPGSMKILNGPNAGDLTDADDKDRGKFDGKKVTIQLGDLPNTANLPDGITVQFKVKALESHAGKAVANKAQINYKNLLKNENESTNTNEVTNNIIKFPDLNPCSSPVSLINGSFENGAAIGTAPDPYGNKPGFYFYPSEVPGWKTTDKAIEIWNYATNRPAGANSYPAPPDGNRFAELNAFNAGMLYQDVKTTPGQTIYWRLSHMGRSGVDTMQVRIGAVTSNPYDTVVQKQISDDKTAWGTYTGSYTVPAGQTTTRFGFEAVSSASGSVGNGNFLDNIFLGTEPCVTSEKTVSPSGDVLPGDELTYNVTVKNSGGDVAANTIIEDAIPEGTEYVPGSMKILNGPNAGNLTDEEDSDRGKSDGKKVTINLGDLPNSINLLDGITVQFKVKALSSQAGKSAINKAQVKYKNLLKNEDEELETNEVTTPIKYKEPILKSEKSATIKEKGKENTDQDHPEVGDTLLYTIKTQNTVSDSLVKNLVISDKLPEGLEYVADSLKVDGKSVTDEKDTDNGHQVDGNIVGQFGDITDTEWHTITFEVKVKEGQASKDIKNIATVDGDNIDEPDKPEEEVKVYPRIAALESEKSAKNLEEGKTTFEVGDTIVYTIKTRNKVSDSEVKNLTIIDELPTGLEYVEGSLKVSHEGKGEFKDGKITANFGDVKDTEWRTVTFEAKIKTGKSGKSIENIATVGGDNIDEPDKPEEKVKVDPKNPKLKSEKTATIKEKAEGNTDKDHPEVGDTLLYTIKTQNTITDSLVKNLVISDELPEGLEYVAKTLKVDGKSVTDEMDTDNGHAVDGKIAGQFGDITNTEWHMITFEVKVKEGQASKDIKNVATVKGDNIDEPDKPEEEVKVYPRIAALESEKSAKNLEEGKTTFEVGDTIAYTIKTRNKVSDSEVKNLTIMDELPTGLEYVEGSLKVSHEGKGEFKDGKITANFGDVKDTEWHTVTFEATIKSGQSGNKIKNVATVGGDNIEEPDKPENETTVDPKDPKLESEKIAVNAEEGKEKFEVGDTIVYTIKTRNTVSDSLVKNLTITDELPTGLEYVEGSLKVSQEGKGEFKDGKITANFGDVKDTEWRTVTFEATIKSGQQSNKLKNVATVGGDNIEEPDKPENETTVDPKDPKLESQKIAVNAEEGKGKFEAGDTIVYTIKTRNSVADSLVENLTITDELPTGLEYVEGSLKVSHEGKGEFKDGIITANFGDVKDTEWRTVTFEATIKSGQSGNKLKNVATVGGDNIEEPDKPENETTVDPKDPKLESKKIAVNAEEGKEKFEVGDTIVYTIKTRNTVSDSLVKNLTISDKLPEGLEYVADSLKVSHDGKGEFKDDHIMANFGEVSDTEWRTVIFEAKIKSGQSGNSIENIATVGGDNIDDPDKPEEKVKVDPKNPKLKSEKTATIKEKAEGNTDKDHPEVGDTLLYTIKTQNTITDSLVKNLVISDELPEGLEYVAKTLKVDGKSVTDEMDTDNGHAVDGKIAGQFGDITNTEWHMITFEVKVKEGQASKDIKNIATVKGDNIDEPDKPEEEVKVYPRVAALESEKSAKNLEESKTTFEVGDTIVYTIKTRNKVSDSEVKNLTIMDELPTGLEYVEGSLKVSHEGKGEFKDGKITANFGDVKDTEWRTVTFGATIKSGQSGNKIKNVATVGGDNIEEPDKPENETTVDPKDPKLESKKIAVNAEEGKEKFEVGDTIVYTIKTRNSVTDSLVENLKITDELPTGLEYVEGSLKVSHEGKGEFKDGKITANFGDVKDTEWRTVTFEAKIKSGQSGKSIENVATVGGDNIDDPDKPEEKVTVDPKYPVLKSEKSARIEKKAFGNTDKDRPEVGDTLLYTIKTQNTVADSLVKNLVISDKLPAGLEYVAGSIKVDGKSVTDAKDSDNGYQADGTVEGQFGDVKDTEWHTLEFLVKVKAGQEGSEIKNIASVNGDNIKQPDKPETEITVKPRDPVIVPRDPIIESEKTAKNLKANKETFEVGDTVVYTIKARNKVTDSIITNLEITDQLPNGLGYVAGSLKVDGQSVTDTKGDDKGHFVDGVVYGQFGNVWDTNWHTVEFLAKVKPGQSGTSIKNIAVVNGDNVDKPSKPETEVTVHPHKPVLESEKTAKNLKKGKEKYEVGDTVVYTIKARNKVTDSLVENLSIIDKLPAGLSYVEGSLKVSHKGTGQIKDGKIVAHFGNVKDTEWRTVTFEAKIKSGQSGKEIKNIAMVDGGNITQPDKPETEVTVYPHKPVLESEKTAKNLKKGKEKYEVGDTVVYTIKARNKVTDSLVENLSIIDKLPAGLSYVEGSLKVSHKGTGQIKDGKIVAHFGDVKDTEWRTVSFEVKIKSGQSGKEIKNIAIVDGDNVNTPQKPEEEIKIDNPHPSKGEHPSKDGHPSTDDQNTNIHKKPNPSSPSKDKETSLPKTGDSDDTLMVTAGVLLLLVSAFSIVATKRRKDNR